MSPSDPKKEVSTEDEATMMREWAAMAGMEAEGEEKEQRGECHQPGCHGGGMGGHAGGR
ncbi:MAG: hypothetical protein FD149_2434 [Rhodospirillaceae bacterium]|nr:MAG: hypothetical protein FD149_2434 [Rhodospirillaceae bacterium]